MVYTDGGRCFCSRCLLIWGIALFSATTVVAGPPVTEEQKHSNEQNNQTSPDDSSSNGTEKPTVPDTVPNTGTGPVDDAAPNAPPSQSETQKPDLKPSDEDGRSENGIQQENLKQSPDVESTSGETVDSKTDGDTPGLLPPSLIEYVSAPYPEAALAEGLEAEVKANLDIDAEGKVTHIEILEPVGHGFDDAAKEAMAAFRFEPATKAGVPIPSRVLYVYRFHLQDIEPPEEATPSPPLSTVLSGLVKDMDDAPLAGAFVTLTRITDENEMVVALPEETQQTSDVDGKFHFENLMEGTYRIEVYNPGFLPFVGEERLVSGEERDIIYRLEAEGAMYETVVRGERPTREVTRREISTRVIKKIPGTSGDALRAVQNLPGLARPFFTSGMLIVRGSAPGDTRSYFDGMNTQLVYHFGGLASVINSDMIKRIDFYPGNFSVRYGKSMGGVIDVETKTPATDRLHAYIDADVWDASAFVEGPISDNWSIAVSGRRSYIDAVLSQIDMGDNQMTLAPRYYDFQILADYHPSDKDHLKLFAYGTDDRMVMIFDKEDDPYNSNNMDLKLMTYQAQAEWRHRFNKTVKNDVRLGFGMFRAVTDLGFMYQKWTTLELQLRDELTIEAGKYATVRLGVDGSLPYFKGKFNVPSDYGGEGEQPMPYTDDDHMSFDIDGFFYEAGMYGEVALNLVPKLETIFGIRGDYFSTVKEWSADPRFSIQYELPTKTVLKGGVGLFHQPPDGPQGSKEYGNPDLDLSYAIQYSVGFEQPFLDNMELSVEGFYKDMRKLVRQSDELVERDGETVRERFNNDGKGRVYGLETQLKHNPTNRFFGWIAYTLMKSERIDGPGEKARPFDYDQTHVLTAVGNVHVGWGIDIGLRFRFTSGNPYTPIIDASYDAVYDRYVPTYGENNSKRMPVFHQLDLRIDKKWQWKYLAFTAYLDVQNVYYAKNAEFYVYSYNYSERGTVNGIPIIPSLGLKVEY